MKSVSGSHGRLPFFCEAHQDIIDVGDLGGVKGMSNMRLRLGLVLFSVVMGVLSCTSSREADPVKPGKVLVIVNGESITSEDVARRKQALFGAVDVSQADPTVVRRMTEQALDAEIMDLLLLQGAREAGLEADQAQVDIEIDRTKEMLGDEDFQKMLQDRGVEEGGFRDLLSERLLIRSFRDRLMEDVAVDDAVLEEYFEGHRDRFQNPAGVRLHIMVIEDRTAADEIYSKLVAGGSFVAAAGEFAKNGGKVSRTRWMPYDVLPDGIRPQVLANPSGEIVRHQEESGKTYLIRILEKREAAFMDFDEAGDMVRSALLQSKRQSVLDNWYDGQLKTAAIEYVRDHGVGE